MAKKTAVAIGASAMLVATGYAIAQSKPSHPEASQTPPSTPPPSQLTPTPAPRSDIRDDILLGRHAENLFYGVADGLELLDPSVGDGPIFDGELHLSPSGDDKPFIKRAGWGGSACKGRNTLSATQIQVLASAVMNRSRIVVIASEGTLSTQMCIGSFYIYNQ